MDFAGVAWREPCFILLDQRAVSPFSLSATLQAPKVLELRLKARKTWNSDLAEMVLTSHNPTPVFQKSQVEVEAPSVGRNEISTQTAKER